jgi:hypothetical protein
MMKPTQKRIINAWRTNEVPPRHEKVIQPNEAPTVERLVSIEKLINTEKYDVAPSSQIQWQCKTGTDTIEPTMEGNLLDRSLNCVGKGIRFCF